MNKSKAAIPKMVASEINSRLSFKLTNRRGKQGRRSLIDNGRPVNLHGWMAARVRDGTKL